MNVILLVIAVFNGNPYSETPMYVVEYKTQEACEAVQRRYPTTGVRFNKAICLPKIPAAQ